MKKLIMLISTALIFTSCTSLMGSDSDSDVYESSVELTYSDMKQIKDNIESVRLEYENLSIDAGVLSELKSDFPDSADTVLLKQVSDFDKNYDKLRKLFISDERYREEYYHGFIKQNPPGREYDDLEEYFYTATNGGFSYMLHGNSAFGSDVVKRIYVDREYDDEVYKLGDREYKISEAVDYTNSLINRFNGIGCGDMQIAYIEVLKFDNEYAYRVVIQRTVTGMELNRFLYLDGNESAFPHFMFDIYISEPDMVNTLLGNTGYVTVDEIVSENETIVDLQSALDVCENVLAANHKYDVESIGLGYMPDVVNAKGETPDEKTLESFYYQDGTLYYAEPGWFIRLDETHDYERMVFVNAVTGEPTVIFNNEEVQEE